jgi:hypothetical protein
MLQALKRKNQQGLLIFQFMIILLITSYNHSQNNCYEGKVRKKRTRLLLPV